MEILIIDNYDNFTCSIYGKKKLGDNVIIIGYDGNFLVEYTLENTCAANDKVMPLFKIPLTQKDIWLNALKESLSKSNYSTENENLIKGKLEATQEHLKDMREISMMLLKK